MERKVQKENKNYAEVLIDGVVYTLGGVENEEYLRKVASYLNEKIGKVKQFDGFLRMSEEYQMLMIELNIADDYFKEQERANELAEQKNDLEKDTYSLKHELITTQMKLENVRRELEDERRKLQELKKKLAENGKEAVEIFKASEQGEFDFILMDVMMPVMDGLEATRIIRKMERPDAVQIPIFAMTANAFSDDRKRCKEAGMTEHLAKPLNLEKMIAKLRLYYNRKV